MARDLRVIIIKMADRVHNIQTLIYHPKREKRIRIAEETLMVYVPVAKRLGLYVFQGFLENGAFKILEPKEYKRIQNFVMTSYGDITNFKDIGIERLEELCKAEGVAYKDIKGRLKSPYRIYKKLLKYQTNDISKVMDILAFRVVS
ncbi:MAG: HD domain-containing protein [Candidatus Peribacteria bacterium]|nr:MAG: HD domain-containing protein [Candidatus Peribacteria bacterium]